jgi:hypothetical protein
MCFCRHILNYARRHENVIEACVFDWSSMQVELYNFHTVAARVPPSPVPFLRALVHVLPPQFVGRGIRAVAFVYALPARIYMFAIHRGVVDPIDVSTAPPKPLIPQRRPHLCCPYRLPHLV